MWASWAVHVSLCLQLPSFRYTWWQRGPAHPLWATWGLTCSNGSSHHQPPPLPQEAPVLLPCLIMWARCLGVSLCHPVVLSASIMPLNGRPSYCGTQFVSVCVSVSVWRISSSTEFHFCCIFFQIAQKQWREGVGYYSPEGVYTNARLKCHSNFAWPV